MRFLSILKEYIYLFFSRLLSDDDAETDFERNYSKYIKYYKKRV